MLTLHIITAISTLACSIFTLWRPSGQIQLIFRVLTGMSLASGALLVLESSNFTRTICIRLGIYLLIIIVSEWMLQKKLRQNKDRTVTRSINH